MTDQDSSEDNLNPPGGFNFKTFILISGLVFLVTSPILLMVLYGMGQVDGVEFSPDDFSRRRFTYNQLPFLGWVIAKKSYEDVTADLEQELVTTKLITPVINKQKRWDLVSESNYGLVSHQCDARFLIGYLEKSDESGANYWDSWNIDYPECAKLFWPKVAEMARDGMYLKVADVMRVAIDVGKDEPEKFEIKLNQALGEVYLELGSIDMELGKLERAEHRLSRSVEFDSTPEAVKKHADCLKQSGR